MPLLNYTTKIDAMKTVSEVQLILAKAGAKAVAVEYGDGGRPTAIVFRAGTPLGDRTFTLPIYPDRVLLVLRKQHVAMALRTIEQAERVAWRIVKDWVEAQLAIIATEMVTLDQIMLPYMQTDNGETVYDRYQQHQLLGPGQES